MKTFGIVNPLVRTNDGTAKERSYSCFLVEHSEEHFVKGYYCLVQLFCPFIAFIRM